VNKLYSFFTLPGIFKRRRLVCYVNVLSPMAAIANATSAINGGTVSVYSRIPATASTTSSMEC